MIPVLIGAGVSALMPLLTEMMRDKPDPEAAKLLIESKRSEMVDKAVGAGLDRKKAEAQVDAEIQKGFAEAERQGQFNFPGGEMIGMAILGGVGGWAAGKAASAIGKMVGKGAGAKASAEAAASKVADVDDVAKATVGSTKGTSLNTIQSSATTRTPSEIRAEIAARESSGRRIDSDDPIFYELEQALGKQDVYSAGFRSPSVDAMRRGAGDRVTGVPPPTAGGNIGYTPPTERGFTMRDADMAPFPSKGRGDFNVEVIGNTGGARMAPVTVEGPFPSMARGGERIGMTERPVGIGFSPRSDAPRVRSDPIMDEIAKEEQMAAMWAARNRVPSMDQRFISGDRVVGERLFP